MVRGERYPVPFRAPKEIEKYEPSLDPGVWIDSYLMAMGIAGHSDLLAARYLPLMMDGANRQWINTLPKDSIDSWEDMRNAFIKHFEGSYSHATTVEDLKRCVQREGESTRKWYNRVADLIKSSENLSVDTVHSHLADNTNFTDLREKLKRTKKDGMSMSELMAIIHKYAESDPTKDDSGEDKEIGRAHV